MANLDKEKVLTIALDYLNSHENNSFLKKEDYKLTYQEQGKLRDGAILDTWIFRYVIKIFGDEKWMFLVISDVDGKILYGVHDAGYFEIKE